MGSDAVPAPPENKRKKDKKEFNCSGCSGLIKLAYVEEAKFHTPQMRMLAAIENRNQSREMGPLVGLMNTFSFFEMLDEESLKEIFSCLVMRNFQTDEIILHRGHPGRYLYFIFSGRVAVLDGNNITIATLGRGEIFGEMSFFSGQPVCASIKAVEPAKILTLSGNDLSQILIKYPFLQVFFTRLLARRLAETNITHAAKMGSAFTGRLSELPPSELFQMLNENAKTGLVDLDLQAGQAAVIFNDGEIIRARYGELKGAKAFYAIIREDKGSFRFSSQLPSEQTEIPPIAPFMKLLMDGLRKIDEEDASQTV